MNKLRMTMLVGAGIATIGTTGIALTNPTSAMRNTLGFGSRAHMGINDKTSFDADLSAALTSKFNLDKTEVQAVIDSVRAEHHNIREQQRLEQLQQALTDEKITQEQYDHIVETWKKIDGYRADLKDASDSERKSILNERQTRMTEFRSWMKAQNLSVNLMMKYGSDSDHHRTMKTNSEVELESE